MSSAFMTINIVAGVLCHECHDEQKHLITHVLLGLLFLVCYWLHKTVDICVYQLYQSQNKVSCIFAVCTCVFPGMNFKDFIVMSPELSLFAILLF